MEGTKLKEIIMSVNELEHRQHKVLFNFERIRKIRHETIDAEIDRQISEAKNNWEGFAVCTSQEEYDKT